MGVILQLLGLIVTFTMAMEGLRRLGLDVGWLNPLTFFRRRAWRKKMTTPPLYLLDYPVDVVAVLALAIVQLTGPVTTQQKAGLRELLSQHLRLSEEDATNLLISSAHLLRNRPLDVRELPALLERSASKFTEYHVQTLRLILESATQIEPPGTNTQTQFMGAVDTYFNQLKSKTGPWAS
jgi:hypothetical protein